MARFIEWLIWLIILGAVGVGGYFGYELLSEMQSAGTDDVSYTDRMMENSQDTSRKETITPKAKVKTVGKESKGCPKVGELMFPNTSSKIYNIVFSRDFSTDKACLKRGPILTGRKALPLVSPGEPGLSVISGHRDTHFKDLQKFGVGQYAVFNDQETKFIYQVRRMKTVVAGKGDTIPSIRSKNTILWISTCFPFSFHGPAPYRRIFELDLIREEKGIKWHNE
ncbi:sortase domain-containing protein [Pasteuria penetrans]|uniref:sortase domain-containing protein n=1 Tax=Pasteuria penetrans TaxID=86005 RepID=UPI0011EE1B07|nr:sortase [Pasteuria penetrans]